MSGRKWLFIGVALGVAVALGHVPYLAGAARALAETALRVVTTLGNSLIRSAAKGGAPRRVILGAAAVVSVLAPGATALLLIWAARGTLRLRAVAGVVLAVLGVASFSYHPAGVASGVVVLALALAGVAVMAAGPFAATPLAAIAGLMGGTYIPTLLTNGANLEHSAIMAMHQALYGRGGTPTALRDGLIIAAIVPFALGVRAIVAE